VLATYLPVGSSTASYVCEAQPCWQNRGKNGTKKKRNPKKKDCAHPDVENRNYRDRKATYAQSLERDVQRARQSEAALLRDIERLRHECLLQGVVVAVVVAAAAADGPPGPRVQRAHAAPATDADTAKGTMRRDRRDTHARSLEREVASLRLREAGLLREVERLRAVVRARSAAAVGNGYSLPLASGQGDALAWSPSSDGRSQLQGQGQGQGQGDGGVPQQLLNRAGLQFASDGDGRGTKAWLSSQSGPEAGMRQVAVDLGQPGPDSSATASPTTLVASASPGAEGPLVDPAIDSPGVRVCEVDPAEAGMDFVLTYVLSCPVLSCRTFPPVAAGFQPS
jgi:hypothetical protein